MSEPITSVVGGTTSVEFKAEPTPPIAPESTPQSDTAQRPDWLPEEFASVEQFVSAYKDLKGGATPPAQEPEGEPESQQNADAEPAADPVVEIVQDAGLDWNDVSGHYAEHGSLTDEHYEKFEAAGLPRSLVDGYLAGQKALANEFRNTVLTAVGGEDAWKAAAEWAAAGNLTEAELAAYNRSVESGDVEAAKLAVQGLIARHARSVGQEPDLADGQGGAASTQGYRSRAEMVRDMKDERYHSDPAFRADVERKVALSTF